MLPSLKNLTNNSLLGSIKNFRQVENNTIADLVLYLSELEQRKLYRDIGFSCLFTYCTVELGYSDGAAYRRVQAAKSLINNPEIYDLLRDGKLTLCAVSEISKVIKPENKDELISSAQGKSKSEVQKITVKYQVPQTSKKETITPKKVLVAVGPLFSDSSEIKQETKFHFSGEVDEEFMQLLKEAKAIVGPIPAVQVLKRTLKEFVSKRKAAPRSVKAVKVSSATRYIPKSVAHQVRKRDEHRCTFIGTDGRRCSETCGLQLDHIKPYALGGVNEASNLRLLCPAHNRFLAEKTFGREKVESYFML